MNVKEHLAKLHAEREPQKFLDLDEMVGTREACEARWERRQKIEKSAREHYSRGPGLPRKKLADG